ncbi:MAG TPA: DUF4912 domain-containing protein [Verrucomicrobiae bacterium]|nr:DUF4912 domain-containing protein [Verrucomicrobiae bacterium]
MAPLRMKKTDKVKESQPAKKISAKTKPAARLQKKPEEKKLPVRRNLVAEARLKAALPSKPLRTPAKAAKETLTSPEIFGPAKSAPDAASVREIFKMPAELPANYGDNMIYLLVRDPYYLYTYWEIQKDHQERTLAKLGGNWADVRSILRIYDTSDKKSAASFFDIELQNMAVNWFINVEPGRNYVVEIGLLHKDGRFLALARSNEVATPRASVSDVLDEEWMGLDFEKLFALSGGFHAGRSSSEDVKEWLQKHIQAGISSGSGGSISSLSSPVKGKQRGFWFVLDCEVIVYGATEPDAAVTFQGRPVKLRPDGTFSFRFSLPDGKFVFDARAVSADGLEERVITPTVQRTTDRPAPVIKSEEKV